MTSSSALANLIPAGVGFHMIRGKPVGSHHRIGSFHSFSFGELPLLNAVASPVFVLRNLSKPAGVICGRLLLVEFRAPAGSPVAVRSQNPDRSCGSKGLLEAVPHAVSDDASATMRVAPIRRFSISELHSRKPIPWNHTPLHPGCGVPNSAAMKMLKARPRGKDQNCCRFMFAHVFSCDEVSVE